MSEADIHTITLTPFTEEYLDKTFVWLNDPEISSMIDSHFITREEQLRWYNGLLSRNNYYVWGLVLKGDLIGVCGIKNIQNGEGEYFGYIGNKNLWGKGIGMRMMELVEAQSSGLYLHTLNIKVLANNHRAVRLYNKMHYTVCGNESGYLFMKKTIIES